VCVCERERERLRYVCRGVRGAGVQRQEAIRSCPASTSFLGSFPWRSIGVMGAVSRGGLTCPPIHPPLLNPVAFLAGCCEFLLIQPLRLSDIF